MRKKVTLTIAACLFCAAFGGSATSAAGKGQVVGLRRLTEQEYRNSIADIFGKDIAVQGMFEPMTKSTGDFYTGLRYGLAELLQSPNFLFRKELAVRAGESATLEPYSRATRLSYLIKAVTTRTVQAVPLVTGEGRFPAMEKTIADLPSRGFFLNTLDAPGKLDCDGNVVMPKPERQVSNETAATKVIAKAP